MSDERRPDGTFDATPKITTPEAEELKLYGTDVKVCGQCKYFRNDEAAQEEIRNQRFYERLAREEGWKVRYLGSDPRTHGLCGAASGEVLTGALHKGCDQFRERRGLMHIRTTKG